MGLLFSFGTLRQPDVQVSVFGHTLEGQPEQLPRFRLTTVAITDPEVVRISGSARHPMLERSETVSDVVQGVVFNVTEEELVAAVLRPATGARHTAPARRPHDRLDHRDDDPGALIFARVCLRWRWVSCRR